MQRDGFPELIPPPPHSALTSKSPSHWDPGQAVGHAGPSCASDTLLLTNLGTPRSGGRVSTGETQPPRLLTSFKRRIYCFLQFSVFWQQPFKRKNHAVIINFAWDQLCPQLSFEMQLHEKQTALISSSLGLLSNKALFQIIFSSWPRVLSLGHRSC